MIRTMKALAGLLLATALVACGGGGGSPGNTGSGTGTDGTGGTGTLPIANFIFTLSKPALTNTGSDSTELTVTALDANNNPVAGAPVTVAVDSGVYTPNSIVTSATGQAGGTITVGADKSNRTILVTMRVGTQTSTASIPVTGAAISVSPVPATPAPGATVRIDIRVADANGTGIANVPVVLSGTLGATGTVTTDATGNATATVASAPAAGSYTVDVRALGVQSTRTVQVAGSAGSGIPAAVGTISSASLSIVPNTIAPNTAGSTTNRAALRARFSNASNQAVQNVRVRFELVPPALGSGEQLSTGSAVVFTDVNGDAIADYIAGTRSSPTDGVVIRACYGLTDAAIANAACPAFVTGRLTVASQPLSITMGDNNELIKGANNLTYIKTFDVAVADAAGNAVPNAVISASVDITHYGKGTFSPGTYQVTGITAPRITNVFSPTANPSSTGRVWCQNEDTNRNGALDTGEDINGTTRLEPRKADVILSFLGANTTGANGRMQIQVEYPQNVATWLAYTVRVTTNVAGSEGTDSKSYITSFVEGDQENGSFLTAPYGRFSCVSPN